MLKSGSCPCESRKCIFVSGGMALLILDLSCGKIWQVYFTPRPPNRWGTVPVPTEQKAEWAPEPVQKIRLSCHTIAQLSNPVPSV